MGKSTDNQIIFNVNYYKPRLFGNQNYKRKQIVKQQILKCFQLLIYLLKNIWDKQNTFKKFNKNLKIFNQTGIKYYLWLYSIIK